WPIVFVGVRYAEELSRLFQSGLTQRRKAFNVCYGSLADIKERIRDVRFAPKSGRSSAHLACLLCANSGRGRLGQPTSKATCSSTFSTTIGCDALTMNRG